MSGYDSKTAPPVPLSEMKRGLTDKRKKRKGGTRTSWGQARKGGGDHCRRRVEDGLRVCVHMRLVFVLLRLGCGLLLRLGSLDLRGNGGWIDRGARILPLSVGR